MFRPLLFGLFVAATIASTAQADISDWLAEVSSGSPAGYTATGIAAPTTADIGTYDDTTGGGVTYEFIVNAGNGGVSSAFMGSLSAPAGDSAGLKFEQWPDSGTYGATAFGVADYDSLIAHIVGIDHQIVFVADGTNTSIYLNGALAGSIAGFSPALSGLTGLGQAYNHTDGATVDPLDGTLLGVAIYDSALAAGEILDHYNAFAIPEPCAALLGGLGMALFALVRRRREG